MNLNIHLAEEEYMASLGKEMVDDVKLDDENDTGKKNRIK